MRVWSAYHGNMLESDSSNYTGPSWKDNHTKTCWKQNILTHSSSHKPHLRELKAGSECAGTHQSPGQASVPRPPPLHRPAAPSAICYQPELLPLNGLPWDQTTHPVRCNHVSPVLCHQVCCLQQLPRQPCICWWTLLHQKWQGEGVCVLLPTQTTVFSWVPKGPSQTHPLFLTVCLPGCVVSRAPKNTTSPDCTSQVWLFCRKVSTEGGPTPPGGGTRNQHN